MSGKLRLLEQILLALSEGITPDFQAVENFVYDTDLLDWVPMTKSSGTGSEVDVLTLPSIPAGGNNIGDVDVASLPSIPSGTNNIGDVDVLTLPNVTLASQGNPFTAPVVTDSRRSKTLLFAAINVSASGDTTLIAADANNKIKVVGYTLVCAGAVNVKFADSSGDLTGAMPFAANGGISAVGGNPSSWLFETGAVNRLLKINLSGAVQVSGHISYFLEA